MISLEIYGVLIKNRWNETPNIALCNYKNLHLPNHTINEVDAISNLSRDTFYIVK